MIERHYGFALEIADKGYQLFQDAIFRDLESETVKKINRSYFKLPMLFLQRLVNRIGKLL